MAVETGGDRLRVSLVDEAGSLRIEQTIKRRGAAHVFDAAIVNTGDEPLAVDWLAAGALLLPTDSAAIRSFTGHHNAEFVPAREPMPAHGWVRENRRGRRARRAARLPHRKHRCSRRCAATASC